MHSHQQPTYLLLVRALPATAAAYPCDCDPLDQHSHDSTRLCTNNWLSAFYIKNCIILLMGDSLGYSFGIETFRIPLMKESYTNPDDKGLSLFWYAIETNAVAGYQ